MKAALAVALLVASFGAVAQTPAQFVENAKRAAKLEPQAETKEAPAGSGKYRKAQTWIKDAAWDVKKTDSLVHPVQAIVQGVLDTRVTDAYPTLEEAQKAEYPSVDPRDTRTKIELIYVPSGKGWRFESGRLYGEILSRWLPIEYEKCSQNRQLICDVVESFEVKR